jgi:hypothetical protein
LTGCSLVGRANVEPTKPDAKHTKSKCKKGPEGPFYKLDSFLVAGATAAAVSTAAAGASTATAAVSTTAAAAGATATTVAATTTAASTTTEAAATGAGRTGFHGTGFIHNQTATAVLLAVHAADSSLCFSIAAHFHKAEALGTASVTFHHDFGAGDGTVGSKCLLQVFVTERIWQVANVKFVAHKGLLKITQNAMESKTAINKPLKT